MHGLGAKSEPGTCQSVSICPFLPCNGSASSGTKILGGAGVGLKPVRTPLGAVVLGPLLEVNLHFNSFWEEGAAGKKGVAPPDSRHSCSSRGCTGPGELAMDTQHVSKHLC